MEQPSPPSHPTTSTTPPGPAGGFPPWATVAFGLAALVFAVLVIARIAVPLAGLLGPAEPPLFEPATLLERRAPDAGVDEWLYATSASGCEVYRWYAQRAAFCRASPDAGCASQETDPDQNGEYGVGYCQGSEPFGDFAARWEIFISAGYNEDSGRTRFLIVREIDWMGGN